MKYYHFVEGDMKLVGRTKAGNPIVRIKDPLYGKWFEVVAINRRKRKKRRR